MDRDEFEVLLKKAPIRVLMNDGNSYVIEKTELAIVSDLYISTLHRRDDGKLGTMHLPLVTVSGVEELEPSA